MTEFDIYYSFILRYSNFHVILFANLCDVVLTVL